MIPPFPLNAASFVPNLSQPLDEVINVGSAGKRHNCFDVRDTVESIEGRRERLDSVSRSNQRSEEHTSELQSHLNLVCRLLLEKKKKKNTQSQPHITSSAHE